jgi:hypothetical protein
MDVVREPGGSSNGSGIEGFHSSLRFDHRQQCSSNLNHEAVYVILYVLLPDGILCPRSISLLLVCVVR